MPETSPKYTDLFDQTYRKDTLYGQGLASEVVPSLMRRGDGNSVFDEGKAFSGIERHGSAESCITAAASPHIIPAYPKESLLTAAQTVLGHEVQLPTSMQGVDQVSPQLVIWWRDHRSDGDGRADLPYIARQSNKEWADFSRAISAQTAKAVSIVTTMTQQQPTIWGSWGFATTDERAATGRGRGVPTNSHGHLHVIDFGATSAEIHSEFQPTARQKLNHYEPWGGVLYTAFSSAIARCIERSVNQYRSAQVTAFSDTVMTSDGGALGTVNNGYTVTFDSPQPFIDIYEVLIEVGGTFEKFYQNVTQTHALYHKQSSHSDTYDLALAMIKHDAGLLLGFDDKDAARLAEFALTIRPTYSQLQTWLEELRNRPELCSDDIARLQEEKERYERVSRLLARRLPDDSLFSTVLQGTIDKPSSENNSLGCSVWPEHASMTFIIDDYEQDDGSNIFVRSLRLIPGIDSTESAPEHKTGRILKREVSNSVNPKT